MLKITYTTERHPNAKIVTKDWGISDPAPNFSRSFLWGIQAVEASGDEKHYIEGNFSNLPSVSAKFRDSVVWVGEYARFIVSNFCVLE